MQTQTVQGAELKRENRKFRVKTTVFPSTGERFVLVEGPPDGIALEATTVYTLMALRDRGCSPNTMRLAMQPVAMMLEWASDSLPAIDIQARLETGQMFSREEVHSLRRDLRIDLSRAAADGVHATVAAGTFYNRCHAVRDYVSWHAENVIRRIPAREHQRAVEHRRRLEDFRDMMVSDLPSPRVRTREGVSEDVQRTFLEAIRPRSPTNPFQAAHQSRNHALLLLYLVHGVRRAEALKVKGEDLFLSGPNPTVRIIVRFDERRDPRRVEPRAKTQGRDLSLGPDLAAALREWVTVHRPTYPGAKKTPYCFIARNGAPLSLQAVGDMFRLLRERVGGLPKNFTSHILRHAANDRLSDVAEEMGWSEAEEKRNRNYNFGWSKTSNQGDAYRTRGTRRRASVASLRMQDKIWSGSK